MATRSFAGETEAGGCLRLLDVFVFNELRALGICCLIHGSLEQNLQKQSVETTDEHR